VLGSVSRLVGVDIDGKAGDALLQELAGGDVPLTLSFTTGRGWRLLYAVPERMCVKTRHVARGDAKVSILGAGALTVMPPSRHRSGRRYRWLPRRGPQHLDAALVPAWMTSAHRQPCRQVAEEGAPIEEGRRNVTLFRMACCLRRHGGTQGEILALLRLVNQRCVPPLADQELQTIARSAAKYAPCF
jgi:hypothetical protein